MPLGTRQGGTLINAPAAAGDRLSAGRRETGQVPFETKNRHGTVNPNSGRAGKRSPRVAGGPHARRRELCDGVAGRETMGHPPLPRRAMERSRKVEIEVAADAEATQQELSRKIGVSRPTVGRACARRAAVASGS
jgi:hypothetical protein